MVYMITYRQSPKSDRTYRDVYDVLDNAGFLHELRPGQVLIAPTCHIYHLRERLSPCLRDDDTLMIAPITVNDFADEEAHRFVEFWTPIPRTRRPTAMRALIQQIDA